MRLILKPELAIVILAFSSVLRYNYNKLDLGIPEDGIAEQTKKTPRFQDKGFNHLLSLNSVIYLKIQN
jgi:iron complex outermembrane receptor protein